MSTFVLVHSPLVGPSMWEPVAAALRTRGESAIVPELPELSRMPSPGWRWSIEAARRATERSDPGEMVLVGHSGAGLLLPGIHADARGYVFVDAEVPKPGPVPVMPGWLRDTVAGLAVGDRLPPWSEWWGPEAMARLVPDAGVRSRVEAELPRLPLAYIDEVVEVPPWPDARGAYLQLSPLFTDDADAAEDRGWPVERFDAGHLHLVVDPDAVADRLVRLAEARRVTDATE